MIIIEGIDVTGKTSLAEQLEKANFERYHLGYDEKNEKGYLRVLKKNTNNLVLDRSFISELVYGPILRNSCRINQQQTKNIIEQYAKVGTKIIYLMSTKEMLLKRRIGDDEDTEMIKMYFDKLNLRYDKVIKIIGKYMPVKEIDTTTCDKLKTFQITSDFITNDLEK